MSDVVTIRIPGKEWGPTRKRKNPDKGMAFYQSANPDGSRKNCESCMMWSLDEKCTIHPEGLRIEAKQVCDAYVFGKPMKKRMEHEGMKPLNPEHSGLIHAPEGVACDNCLNFKRNMCHAVANQDGSYPSPVEPRGCCDFWEYK